jgi:hypothetical protein
MAVAVPPLHRQIDEHDKIGRGQPELMLVL